MAPLTTLLGVPIIKHRYAIKVQLKVMQFCFYIMMKLQLGDTEPK